MAYPEVKKGALDKLNAPKFSARGELSSFRFLGTKQFSNWKQESHYLKKISKVFNCSPHDFMTTCSFCGGASWSFTYPSVGIKHSAPCRLRPINITKPRFCKDLYNRLVEALIGKFIESRDQWKFNGWLSGAVKSILIPDIGTAS